MGNDEINSNASDAPQIYIAGDTYVGTRQYQQDTYYFGENDGGCLAVICDGMGGAERGEVASQYSIKMLVEDFRLMTVNTNPFAFLRNEAIDIDAEVASIRDEDGRVIDTGTTIVAVVIRDRYVWWLSVGDSRIFISRNNQFSAVTEEHNYKYRLDALLCEGRISEEEYLVESEKAEALISYIGMGGLELIDQNEVPFTMQRHDRLLLCSDGLSKAISEERIKEIMLEHSADVQDTLDALMAEVRNCGKRYIDNTTAILISYE